MSQRQKRAALWVLAAIIVSGANIDLDKLCGVFSGASY